MLHIDVKFSTSHFLLFESEMSPRRLRCLNPWSQPEDITKPRQGGWSQHSESLGWTFNPAWLPLQALILDVRCNGTYQASPPW